MLYLKRWNLPLVSLTLAALAGCESADGGGRSDLSNSNAGRSNSPAAHPATTPPVPALSGPINEALAAVGETAFAAKGCVACHYVAREERLVGPDLAGVTERRSWPWFYAMVTNPDSMLRNDPEAKTMLGQYMTPMAEQGLTDSEVQSIWEYLRRGPNTGS